MTATTRRLIALAGTLSFAAAGVLVWVPGLADAVIDVPALERAADERLGWTTLLVAFALLVCVALWKGRSTATVDADSFGAGSVISACRRSDREAFDRAVSADAEKNPIDPNRSTPLQRRLRRAAIDRIAVVDDVDGETAADRVDAGRWTDDRLVTSFLGDETAPDAPLRWRLFAWLYADRVVERAVDRTIAAIDAYSEDEP